MYFATTLIGEAQAIEQRIQNYLTSNRTGYEAAKWADVITHQNGLQFAIPLPDEYPHILMAQEIEDNFLADLEGWVPEPEFD